MTLSEPNYTWRTPAGPDESSWLPRIDEQGRWEQGRWEQGRAGSRLMQLDLLRPPNHPPNRPPGLPKLLD
jgi:hypothetical protein